MAVDWAAARLDYVTHHELTYADIAAKYQAPSGTIENRAARERWTEQRKTASEQLLEKVREKVAFNASEELARCNASHLDLSRKLEAAAKQRLERDRAVIISFHAGRSIVSFAPVTPSSR